MSKKTRQVLTGGFGALCFLLLSSWAIVYWGSTGVIKVAEVMMVMTPIITAVLFWTAGKRPYALGIIAGTLLFCLSLALGVYLYWR